MSTTRRRLAWIGPAAALLIAVQLHGTPLARAAERSTTATTADPTSTTSGSASTTSGPTSTTTAETSATTGPTSSSSPAAPGCEDVLAGGEQGSLTKTRVGGDEQAGFDVWRVQTDRPAGVYHVVDCIRADQVFPNPAIIDTVDLGDVHVSGTATFRVDIPGSAIPGSDVCDRFVVSGEAGGVPFTDVSDQVCSIYTGCLGFGPGTCPPEPSTTAGVGATTPGGGTLPFTGNATWPLLVTAVALLGLGVASLVAARWRDHRPTL
jgi:hypothetical protein